jgi:tRNA 2-thiouridine synthesizing protein A
MDLSGVVCPENAALVLLKLAAVPDGSCIAVIVDDGLPIKYVPHSVTQEGHKIIATEQMENKWKLIVKKC